MKTSKRTLNPSKIIGLLIFFMMIASYGNAQILDTDREALNKPETMTQVEIIWNVKAYSPDELLLRVKAIDKDGNVHDVKAIQDSENASILNVKAFVNGQRLPIKLIVRDNESFYSAKAIAADGTLIDIKAFTPNGEILDIKGVNRSGNIIQLRAINLEGVFYNIIAVSPDGKVNAVQGIKMMDGPVETVINGVSVFAHVKAIKQR